jgi:hypothetical protein
MAVSSGMKLLAAQEITRGIELTALADSKRVKSPARRVITIIPMSTSVVMSF